ncbi:MAG: hotdog fold thioesterase [Acidimicrobiia bacterium]
MGAERTNRQSDSGLGRPAFVREFIEGMPVTSDLGMELVEIERGRATVSLAIKTRHTVDGHLVQAGISATVADFAAVAAAATELPDGWLVATTGFSVVHLAPATGEILIAEGRYVGGGPRRLVATADLYVEGAEGRRQCLTGVFSATGLPPTR